MRNSDLVSVARPGDANSYKTLPSVVVDAGLVAGLQLNGLLPQTVRSDTAPGNVNILWIDTSGNQDILKKFNGAAWVFAGFQDVYAEKKEAETVYVIDKPVPLVDTYNIAVMPIVTALTPGDRFVVNIPAVDVNTASDVRLKVDALPEQPVRDAQGERIPVKFFAGTQILVWNGTEFRTANLLRGRLLYTAGVQATPNAATSSNLLRQLSTTQTFTPFDPSDSVTVSAGGMVRIRRNATTADRQFAVQYRRNGVETVWNDLEVFSPAVEAGSAAVAITIPYYTRGSFNIEGATSVSMRLVAFADTVNTTIEAIGNTIYRFEMFGR